MPFSCCGRHGSAVARERRMGEIDRPDGTDLPGELEPALRDWRLRNAGCPRPDLLQAAEAGVLPPDEAEPVLRHLETCRTCESLLRDLAPVDEAPLETGERQRIWSRIERSYRA